MARKSITQARVKNIESNLEWQDLLWLQAGRFYQMQSVQKTAKKATPKTASCKKYAS